MKTLYILLGLILIVGCKGQNSQNNSFGEEKLLLSGKWKFYTIKGDGANNIGIHPDKDDIIIDNIDREHIEIKGKWETTVKTRGENDFW